MGRKKLVIKRLEDMKDRQTKYSKRKIGILKKAYELSVLCEVDIALLMFSPAGRPSLFVRQNKNLLNVVKRLSKVPVEERQDRRGYTMQMLSKLYSNSEVDPRNFSLDRTEFLKMLEDRFQDLNEKLTEKKRILSEWENPRYISDPQKLKLMKEHLVTSLETVRARKQELILQEQQAQFQQLIGQPSNSQENQHLHM